MKNNRALLEGTVVVNKEVAPGQFLINLKLPASFPAPLPGQFVMLRVPDFKGFPLLARPFSVYAFDKAGDKRVMEVIYRIAGQGTRALSNLSPGAALMVLGPLGKGFAVVPGRANIVLIGGGMGFAPLSFLAGHYFNLRRQGKAKGESYRQIIFYLGARTADALAGLDRMEGCCDEIKISTDDGSMGRRGTVIDLFRRDMAFYSPQDTVAYACGPAPMLKELAGTFRQADVFCQVSMEERMACGLGACLGCAVSVKANGGDDLYKRVCKDGPVFNIKEINWT